MAHSIQTVGDSRSADYQRWVNALRILVKEFSTQDLGYPGGTNEVRNPQARQEGVPVFLHSLYEVCDGISLPDVQVGYFLEPASRVAAASKRGEPTRIEGKSTTPIHVFGSDGGGGRFAVGSEGAVYYLPSSGAVVDGAFLEDATVQARRVAPTVIAFLTALLSDIETFVHHDGRDL